MAFFFLGRFPDATQAFENAVRIDPSDADSWLDLGDSYRQSGKPQQAPRAYKKAIDLALQALETNARDTSALGILATASAEQGDLTTAAKYIHQARQIDAKDNDLMYREAVVRALSGQFPEALESLRNALSNGYPVFESKGRSGARKTAAEAGIRSATKGSGRPRQALNFCGVIRPANVRATMP